MCVRPDPITQIVNRIGTVNCIYQPVLTWFEILPIWCDRTSNFRCLSNYSLRYMLIFFKRTCLPCLAVRLCIVYPQVNPSLFSWAPVSIFPVFHFPLASRRWVTRSFRDCKGKRSFWFCKENNFYFFCPLLSVCGVYKLRFFYRSCKLHSLSFFHASHRLRSLAGCKGNKLFGSCKIKMKFFLNPLFPALKPPALIPFPN